MTAEATTDPHLVQRLEGSDAEVAHLVASYLPGGIYEDRGGYTLAGTTSSAAVRQLAVSPEGFDAAAAAWEARFRALGRPAICFVSPVTSPADAARRLRRRGYFAGRPQQMWATTEAPPPLPTPKRVLLRRGLPADAPALAEIVRRSWGGRVSTPVYMALASLWPRPPGIVDYVAEVEGTAVAWILIARRESVAATVLATALPGLRSRGAASSLAAWTSRDLFSSGCDLFWGQAAVGGPGERLARRAGASPRYLRTPWVRVPGPWPVRALANLTRPLRRRLRAARR